MLRKLINILSLCVSISVLSLSGQVKASVSCDESGMLSSKIMTDMCWSCFENFYISGMKIGFGVDGGTNRPKGAYNDYTCSCQQNGLINLPTGIPFGFWKIGKAVEIVRQDGCSPMLGKLITGDDGGFVKDGFRSGSNGDSITSYMGVNVLSFPIEYMLGLLSSIECASNGFTELDFLYTSYPDVSFQDETFAFFNDPFAGLFSGPIGVATAVAECAAVATTGKPFSNVPFTAGCWGPIYPTTGWGASGGSPVQKSKAVTVAALAMQNNRGFQSRQYGKKGICNKGRQFTLDKEGLMLNQFYPSAETKKKYPIGTPTLMEGEWKLKATGASDFVQFGWQYRDCCIKIMD